jgi:hypothetical protein
MQCDSNLGVSAFVGLAIVGSAFPLPFAFVFLFEVEDVLSVTRSQRFSTMFQRHRRHAPDPFRVWERIEVVTMTSLAIALQDYG